MYRWWQVKVYHELSNSTTTISSFAESVEDIKENLASEYVDSNSWVFVSAYPEE